MNIQVFHINEGAYHGRRLDGTTSVLVGIPDAPYGGPYPRVVYMDYGLYEDDLVAVQALFQGFFGLMPQQGFRRARIESRFDTNKHIVNVSGLIKYDVEAKDSDEVSAGVRPYLYGWLHDPKQWTVTTLQYHSRKRNISYMGTNSLTAHSSGDPPTPAATMALSHVKKISNTTRLFA